MWDNESPHETDSTKQNIRTVHTMDDNNKEIVNEIDLAVWLLTELEQGYKPVTRMGKMVKMAVKKLASECSEYSDTIRR